MNYDYLISSVDNFSVNNPTHQVIMPSYERTDPRLNNYNNILDAQRIQDKNDEQWLENWLTEKGKINLPLTNSHNVIKRKNDISINVARDSLKKCLLIMQKINSTEEELQKNVDTMSSIKWKQKTVDIGTLKDEFNKIMVRFEDTESLIGLKKAVKKREKKRINQKSRKLMGRELMKSKREERLKMHQNIDLWLESMKEAAEKVKMEARQKQDGDCILYEVTKKKADGRKHLSLISALVKLRTVRESMKLQKGEITSMEDRTAFGLVTEKLVRMWEDSLQKYANEEQYLQSTLKQNAAEDNKLTKLAKEKIIAEEWQIALFGSKYNEHINNPTYWAFTSADRDMETFIAIRKSWDTFLVAQNSELGTKIPLGWVLPTDNPNWTYYLGH